jgi:hypothetical protein
MLKQMTSDRLILLINKELKKSWTRQESAKGKLVHVDWAWAAVINECIVKYRSKGWTVSKHVEIGGTERQLFLCFKNKNWSKRRQLKKSTKI